MAQKTRLRCFVGTSVAPTEEEILLATAASVTLFKRNFLPIMPHIYQQLLEAKGEDYEHIRLDLLSQCQSAIWLGEPTQIEAKACIDLGLSVVAV